MRIQKLDENSRKNLLEDLLKRSPNNYGQYEQGVTEILANVKANGDQALFEYTKKFDQADLNAGNIKVTDGEIEEHMMYNTFNMGVGMVLAVDPADAEKTMAAINASGEKAFIIGKAVAGEKGVTVC